MQGLFRDGAKIVGAISGADPTLAFATFAESDHDRVCGHVSSDGVEPRDLARYSRVGAIRDSDIHRCEVDHIGPFDSEVVMHFVGLALAEFSSGQGKAKTQFVPDLC